MTLPNLRPFESSTLRLFDVLLRLHELHTIIRPLCDAVVDKLKPLLNRHTTSHLSCSGIVGRIWGV